MQILGVGSLQGKVVAFYTGGSASSLLPRFRDGSAAHLESRCGRRKVKEILTYPGEDRPGRDGSRPAIGQAASGRYLKVVYIRDPKPDSVFVITAYELRGKPLFAYRRRQRRKRDETNPIPGWLE